MEHRQIHHRSLHLWTGLLALVITGLDQITKALVQRTLGPTQAHQQVALISDWLALAYVENRGAAFGVLAGQGIIVTALGLAALSALLAYYRQAARGSPWLAWSVGLIVGGALGNLIDRLRLGFVVDFVAVGPWPKFNLADSAITIGVGLLALHLLVDTPRPPARVGGSPPATPESPPDV